MKLALCFRLAKDNIKKNKKLYIPYAVTIGVLFSIFYVIKYLSENENLASVSYGNTICMILNAISYIILFFSLFFLCFANRLLVREETFKLGLYQVLGAKKIYTFWIFCLQQFIIYIIVFLVSIIIGSIISPYLIKLFFFLTKIKTVGGFAIDLAVIIKMSYSFGIIFVLQQVFNLVYIMKYNPIDTILNQKKSEKKIKFVWIRGIISISVIAIGYWFALNIKNSTQVVSHILIAAIMVIVGTISLLQIFSVIILQICKKNNEFYYRKNNFFLISNFAHKLNQNSLAISLITILFVGILTVSTAGAALYAGADYSIQERYPNDIQIWNDSAENNAFKEENLDTILKKENISLKGYIDLVYAEQLYEKTGENLNMCDTVDYTKKNYDVYLISMESYNKAFGKNIQLSKNEVILYDEKQVWKDNNITFNNKQYHVQKMKLEGIHAIKNGAKSGIDSLYVIATKDEIVKSILPSSFSWKEYIGIDITGSFSEKLEIYEDLNNQIINSNLEESVYASSQQQAYREMYFLYGAFFYISILLSIMLLVASTVILYYKLTNEVIQDQEKFEIMKYVGMKENESKKIIGIQMKLIYVFPVFVAFVHFIFVLQSLKICLNMVINLSQYLLIQCSIAVLIFVLLILAMLYLLVYRRYYRAMK